MNFNYVSLSDICLSIVDCPHTTPIWKESGIPVVRNFNIKNGKLDTTKQFYVDEETYKERTKRAIPEYNDIIISREAPMGELCLVPKGFKCCLGQRLVLIKINKELCYPKYLLYIMLSEFVQKQIKVIDATGSIVSNLNIPDLKALKIPLIDMKEQIKIGDLLSNIDNKIELNSKINSELEKMAKTLYEYWFVQFDFTDENKRPYKSANGKMVYNNILKREIPEGWDVVKLKDLVSINKTKSKPCSNKKLIDLSVMPSKTMCLNGFSNGDTFETNMFTMKKYDILFGSIRPYLLKAGFAPFDGLVSGTIHSISPKDTTNTNYLIMTTVSKSLFDYAIKCSKGTKMPVIGIDDLLDYKIPYSKVIANKFEQICSFKEKIAQNIQENIELSSLRDLLLP